MSAQHLQLPLLEPLDSCLVQVALPLGHLGLVFLILLERAFVLLELKMKLRALLGPISGRERLRHLRELLYPLFLQSPLLHLELLGVSHVDGLKLEPSGNFPAFVRQVRGESAHLQLVHFPLELKVFSQLLSVAEDCVQSLVEPFGDGLGRPALQLVF